MKDFIELSYSDLYNAGDLMNVDIVEKLSGMKVKRTKTYAAEMTAIGGALFGLQYSDSIKRRLAQLIFHIIYGKKPVYVWGSGFWHDYNKHRLFRTNLKVLALRGAKSAEKLYKLTGVKHDVLLADAGLLVNLLFTPSATKEYKIGLIPHMSQIDESGMKQFASMADVHLIDIRHTPAEVGLEISKCEVIASSSLHGLIFADALGVPNMHIMGEKNLREGNFKFEDYYSSYGLEDRPCILSEHIPTYDEIIDSYRIDINAVKDKQKRLAEVFPKELKVAEN